MRDCRRIKALPPSIPCPIKWPRPPLPFPSFFYLNRAPRPPESHAGATIAAGKKLQYRSPWLSPSSPPTPFLFLASMRTSKPLLYLFYAAEKANLEARRRGLQHHRCPLLQPPPLDAAFTIASPVTRRSRRSPHQARSRPEPPRRLFRRAAAATVPYSGEVLIFPFGTKNP